ncbi:glycoside hydrolase [Trametes versicolor FP-101664 SS1]|uniref:glycoside hydrolase n=1 Tax=Trametes versicolor (strain FP-101664) TaxID=717944 RepID=UPI0004622225|nr:glycoside hydrolase [Trametes versicolor FP-101664 SS1]EIW52338.1 glycoside hydrolase [Trametes versicolor FP-101664 SS1]
MLLDQSWVWKERDPSIPSVIDEVNSDTKGWTPATSFPSEIHAELIKAKRIPDPFVGFNEHEVQWVGEREWLYRTSFELEVESRERSHFELLFEGLDTVCDVYLNGAHILAADNMFRAYSVSVPRSSLKDAGNSLLLHFKSAKLVAKELEARYGRVRAGSTNLGDPSRGPEIMTCGPYRPIKLLAYTLRIASVYTHALVSPAPELAATLRVDATLAGDVWLARYVRVTVLDGIRVLDTFFEAYDNSLEECSLALEGIVNSDFSKRVQLWWPVGYGEQYLYDIVVELLSDDFQVLDRQSKKVGFRRVELVQEPLDEPDRHGKGTTFPFEVNGVRMFMGGSNWIPAHSILTELRAEDYRAWLTLLRDGNQNMVRLWGGGVYEPDCFYDICDELGILVWQDFQFACGVYPAHPEFIENVRKEAEDNIIRLRHHPSLALFCGNNEDYQQVLQWGDVADLPARVLYEDILPGIVAALCDPPIPYHRGSPYGGEGWDTSDPTVGDIHQWDIWAGKERPWQEYAFRNGRFISEFGIPSFPDIKTVDYWLDGNVKERWAQSRLMAQHNRAGNHERRFAIVMNENFRLTGDLETHVYNTQILQSEAVSLAYRMWRREWRGRGKEFTAGALIWQLNDCWPVVSWSIVDFFRRAKPAYYTIARELKPITVGIIRNVTQNRENDRPKQFYEFGAFRSVGATIEVWGTNSTLEARAVLLELRCFDLYSSWMHTETRSATLLPNQSTELLAAPCPHPPIPELSSTRATGAVTPSHSVVVGARLIAPESGEVLARYADWPQPFRHVDFPDPVLRVVVDSEGGTVSVGVEKPVKGLFFTVDQGESLLDSGETVRWSDNALDVLPGDPQTVEVRGLEGRDTKLRVAYMGCERGIPI